MYKGGGPSGLDIYTTKWAAVQHTGFQGSYEPHANPCVFANFYDHCSEMASVAAAASENISDLWWLEQQLRNYNHLTPVATVPSLDYTS